MSETYFLFARPSFIEGMARVLDIGNTLRGYNESPSPRDADSIAIHTDWMAIGRDINNAILEISALEDVKQESTKE